jgi:hypothetical protein
MPLLYVKLLPKNKIYRGKEEDSNNNDDPVKALISIK